MAGAKTLIIGLDAGDKDVIRDLAARGRLPNFARLLAQAEIGATANPPGMEAGAVWPSFYTGVSPAEHGMFYAFSAISADGYFERPFEQSDFTAEPFWKTLSRRGKRVCVIDAPYTYLAEGLNGIHVVDWGAHAPMSGLDGLPKAFRTWPESLAGEIRAKHGTDTVGYCDQRKLRTAAELKDLRDKLIDRTRRRTALSLDLLGREDWDLFLTVFHECHCAGHQCWHTHDPAHPRFDAKLTADVGDVIELVYAEIDAGVGRLLAQAGPNADVIVYCSHGMGQNVTGTLLLDAILMRLEGLRESTGGRAIGRSARRLWHMLPGGAKAVMAPLHKRFWQKTKTALYFPDRHKRRCFEVRNNDATGGIRLNLKGRDAHGILEPGAETDAFVAQLTADLMEIVNADTGQPIIRRVIRTDREYSGPRVRDLPDLLIDWNRTGEIARVSSPKIGTLENRDLPDRSGDHRPEGMYLALGPRARPGLRNEPTPVAELSRRILNGAGGEPERREAAE